MIYTLGKKSQSLIVCTLDYGKGSSIRIPSDTSFIVIYTKRIIVIADITEFYSGNIFCKEYISHNIISCEIDYKDNQKIMGKQIPVIREDSGDYFLGIQL